MINRLWMPLLVVSAVGATGQAFEKPEVAKPPLQFSIESSANTLVRCEPLQLKLVVANKTKHAIETTLPLAALECIHVQYGDGPFEKWRRGWIQPGCIIGWPSITIEPGESREYPVELIWQKDYPVFDRAGKYRVKADWRGTAGRYTDFKEFVVVEGTEREKQCFEVLRRNHLLHWLGLESDYMVAWDFRFEKRDTWRDDLKTLFRIAKRYHDTRYAKYCLGSVLNTFESSLRHRMKLDRIDESFKQEVVRWTEQRCAQQTDARTLYSYAWYLYRKNRSFVGNVELGQKLLTDAHALEPDVALEKRIEKLGFKAQIDLRLK